MIEKIRLQGLLSFEDMELELRNLNVLIGPNGSGKSNLIEALSLLQALPTDIAVPLNAGGGINEWLRHARTQPQSALVEAWVQPAPDSAIFHYRIGIRSVGGRYEIDEESLSFPQAGDDSIVHRVFESKQPTRRSQFTVPLSQTDMVLCGHEINAVSVAFTRSALYRGWCFGISSPPRQHQPADLPPDFLMETTRNLALIINEFDNMGGKPSIESEFRKLYGRCDHFSVSIFANQIILNMHEEGLDAPVPATRWSDGMIRYLCLLAILCHPNPPGLIAIDEPELGFHPDVLPNLARLIKEASERTQIIITTHSKQLVDEFSDDPEAVVVCERGFDGETTMRRLDAGKLDKWLQRYSLGDLWESGEIGGDLY